MNFRRFILVMAFLEILCAAPFSVFAWPIPDTGQTTCYDELGAEIDCAGTGQDGEYEIDPPSYTKLDINGNDLDDDAPEWFMVRDNVTGLIWEVKQNKDGTPNYNNPHDADNTYTWYNPDDATPGKQGDGVDSFDTLQFIEALNNANFGGVNSWRIPTLNEILSINDYNVLEDLLDPKPTINTIFFSGTLSSEYWLSETISFATESAWYFSFLLGHSGSVEKTSGLYVRAVCSGWNTNLGEQISNEDVTVIDKRTGLMWEKKTDDGGFRDKDHTYTFSEALDYCKKLNLGGYADWRLPTVKELDSIVDANKFDPSINSEHFPNTASTFYASSTTDLNIKLNSWCVHFGHGDESSFLKMAKSFAVRAVRGGQPQAPGNLLILKPARASFWQIGSNMNIQWRDDADIPNNVKISISYEGGKPDTYQTIAASTPNDGQFTWTIPDIPSFNCMLKIEPVSDRTKGTVQGLFTIGRFIQTDPPDLVLAEPAASTTIGESKTFQLSIPEAPSGDAVFNLYSSNPAECTVSPATLTLDSGNYATGETVTVTPTFDGVRDGEQRAFILVTTADANAGFFAYEAPILTVTVRDAQTDTTLTSAYPAYLLENTAANVTLRGHGFSIATQIYIYKDGDTPEEISSDDIEVIDDTTLSVTLPGKPAGNYHLKADTSILKNAVTFAATLDAQARKKAIIVAGGGPRADNSLWNAAEKCTRNAYRTLTFQGYSADSIQFFSGRLWDDVTGDGANDIDGDATLANLQDALTTWATTGTDEVLLCIVAESGNKTIRLGTAATEILTAATLDGWLDTLQADIAGPVVVILDACLSGGFLQPLAAENRVVIASAQADQRAWFLNDGELSFSHRLFDRLFSDPALYSAFTDAKDLTGDVQTPAIDIDGDGAPDDVSNKHDPVEAVAIGRLRADEDDPPSIQPSAAGVTPPSLSEPETTATVFVHDSGIVAPNALATVWAEITPPDTPCVPPNTPGIVKPSIRLTESDPPGTHQNEYTQFDWNGVYKIEVYAVDKKDHESVRVPITLEQDDGILPGLGDMNGDLRVTIADVIYVLRIMAGEPLSPPPTADYDQDGKTELADAIFILQMVAGVRE